MISYQDFLRLVMDVSEFVDLDAYVAEVGGSVPRSVQDEKVVQLLSNCWTYARKRDAATIRGLTGLSRAAFARTYRLPLRSLENWESSASNARSAPPYLLDLLAYSVIVTMGVGE